MRILDQVDRGFRSKVTDAQRIKLTGALRRCAPSRSHELARPVNQVSQLHIHAQCDAQDRGRSIATSHEKSDERR